MAERARGDFLATRGQLCRVALEAVGALAPFTFPPEVQAKVDALRQAALAHEETIAKFQV